MCRSYKILILSSYPPGRSAGLAQDYINAFQKEGHEVDFLTLYGYPNRGGNEYCVYPEHLSTRVQRWANRYPILQLLRPNKNEFLRTIKNKIIKRPSDGNSVWNNGFYIPNIDERIPPVDINSIIQAIPKNNYDFVYVIFMQRMLTTATLLAIYEKLHVPIFIAGVDMASFTGGCFYFGNCERYMQKCGKCPILQSDDDNDQTRRNFEFKQDVYKKIQCAYFCNSYQKKFVDQSGIFSHTIVQTRSVLLDEYRFLPLDMDESRKYFSIPGNKKFVIFSRFAGQKFTRAKGYDHLVTIINQFVEKLEGFSLQECLLVLAGVKDVEFESLFNMDVMNVGSLDMDELIKMYSASSVFISTSIDDAGPSMVNQSMMCGTPVVTFSIGTSLDVIKNGRSGYMAENYNDDDFADGIYKIYTLQSTDYINLRENTRNEALKHNTSKVIIKRITDVYEQIIS